MKNKKNKKKLFSEVNYFSFTFYLIKQKKRHYNSFFFLFVPFTFFSSTQTLNGEFYPMGAFFFQFFHMELFSNYF